MKMPHPASTKLRWMICSLFTDADVAVTFFINALLVTATRSSTNFTFFCIYWGFSKGTECACCSAIYVSLPTFCVCYWPVTTKLRTMQHWNINHMNWCMMSTLHHCIFTDDPGQWPRTSVTLRDNELCFHGELIFPLEVGIPQLLQMGVMRSKKHKPQELYFHHSHPSHFIFYLLSFDNCIHVFQLLLSNDKNRIFSAKWASQNHTQPCNRKTYLSNSQCLCVLSQVTAHLHDTTRKMTTLSSVSQPLTPVDASNVVRKNRQIVYTEQFPIPIHLRYILIVLGDQCWN